MDRSEPGRGKDGSNPHYKSPEKKYDWFAVLSHMIVLKPTIKYLGMILDAMRSFKGHISYACEKAAKATTALVRMMPKVGGPKQYKLLIAGVVQSILLYVSPV